MGCDGGTIPKRCELVREKKKPEQRDKDIELLARWLLCALSQLPLRLPIVACELGKLYNKESVLEFLLDRSKFESAEHFTHIKSLKDVHTLRLTPNPYASGNGQPSSSASSSGSTDRTMAQFICPISRCELNGKQKFIYPITCCCVFSDRALRELVPKGKAEVTEISCPVCGVPFNVVNDVVALNPEPGAEQEEAKQQMERRRLAAKSAKAAASKKKAAGQQSDGVEGTSKRPLTETGGKAAAKASDEKKAKIDSSLNGKFAAPLLVASTSKIVSAQKDVKDVKQTSAVYRSLFTSSDTGAKHSAKPKLATVSGS